MDRDKIYGVDYHPELETLRSLYGANVSTGEYFVTFDNRAWGKSTNLFCYFTDTKNGQKYRLSVFHRQDYRPYDNSVSFREAPLGGSYLIQVADSKNGLPKFMSAKAV